MRPLLIAMIASCAVMPSVASQAPRGIRWPQLLDRPPVDTVLVPSRPQLQIGSASGAGHSLLNGVAGASRLTNGGLAVADAGNQRILFFGSDGRFLREVGRAGDGPGEFRQPRWFGRCADGGLALQDGVHARLTFVSSDGDIESSRALPLGANFDQVLWCSRGGRLFMLLDRPRDPVQKGTYPLVPTYLLQAGGGAVDTIQSTGHQAFYIGRAVSALTTVPLGQATLAAAGRAAIYVCANFEGRCQVFDTLGISRGAFTVRVRRPTMRRADWSIALAEHLRGEPNHVFRRVAERLLLEIEPRTAFPLLDEIRVDYAGNVWARTFDSFDQPTATWIVLRSDGRPLALIAMPRAIRVLEIGPDYLVGLLADDDGVESVATFTLPPVGLGR